MKNQLRRLLCVATVGTMVLGAFTGCGSAKNDEVSTTGAAEATSATETKKIGVLVADVSGEEAQGFRNYYENYIAANYDVEFTYTDALASGEEEKAAIEKFASKGYEAVISLSGSDRAQQIETCEKYGIYYAIASGVLDDEQYETYKGYEHFVGQVGPSTTTEFEAGKAMGEYYKAQGVSNVAIYGAFIPNPMHVYRVAGLLVGLGDTYDGSDDMSAVVGSIFQDQSIDLKKVAGDVNVVAYLQGYGDTTTDELNAAIQKTPDAFLSVGMATTFFAQPLAEANIAYSDIDSFTSANQSNMTDGTLTYIAAKYSSSIGPVFALVMNALNGNVIRDNDGNAPSISQGFLVATDSATFDTYYVADNGDAPIYDKTALDTIIGADVTYEDVVSLVEAK